jgi:alkylhydroperoxidase family enzyme
VPRITVPADQDPLLHLWATKAPALTPAAAAFSHAVYERSTLPLREFEAARYTIAGINDCTLCQDWRSARDVAARADDPNPPDEAFYEHIDDPSWSGYSERERLCIEFARRFATDHLNMDDDLWSRLHAHFDDSELVELALCVGAWIAFGRLNRVFDVDGACRIPS